METRKNKKTDNDKVLSPRQVEWCATFDLIQDIIMLLDSDNIVVNANLATVKFLNLPLNEIIGKSCYKLMHSSDKPIDNCPIEKAKKTKRHERSELYLKERNIWIVASVDPLFDPNGKMIGGIHIIRDVTERVKTQAELRERELELRRLYNANLRSEEEKQKILFNIPELVVYQDLKNKILWANESTARAFSKTVEQLIGSTCYKIFHNKEYPCEGCPVVKAVRTGNPEEMEMSSPDGRSWIIKGIPMRDDKGNIEDILEIAIDITDRKKMEMEMEEHRDHLQMLVWGKTQELMESQRRLIDSEKLAALGKLAGSIAHEIRNPLAVMQNAIYYLMDSKSSKDTATIREYLAIIKRNIGISDKIITNVLNFAKQKKVDLIRSSINKTIDEALSKISIPKEIKIEKCYAADSEISHDVSLTEEVFHNLILNSMQAIRKEGLLKISTFKDGECTKITIEDNGEGITKADLPRIFEPLFSKKETGVGFGMSIVKDIVDKHGWEIGIESTEGKGTTVTIMIPGQCAG